MAGLHRVLPRQPSQSPVSTLSNRKRFSNEHIAFILMTAKVGSWHIADSGGRSWSLFIFIFLNLAFSLWAARSVFHISPETATCMLHSYEQQNSTKPPAGEKLGHFHA